MPVTSERAGGLLEQRQRQLERGLRLGVGVVLGIGEALDAARRVRHEQRESRRAALCALLDGGDPARGRRRAVGDHEDADGLVGGLHAELLETRDSRCCPSVRPRGGCSRGRRGCATRGRRRGPCASAARARCEHVSGGRACGPWRGGGRRGAWWRASRGGRARRRVGQCRCGRGARRTRAARSMTPNSVTNVAPPSPELGLPAMTPKPISRYAGMRMLARWPGEFIQAAMMAFGLASSPVPQARFSPIRQAPPSGR